MQLCLVVGQHGENNGEDERGDGGTVTPTRTEGNALLLV